MSDFGKCLATKCRHCGTDYGERAWILFEYCLWCNELTCCAKPETRAQGICGHCRQEDSVMAKAGRAWAERLEKAALAAIFADTDPA